MTTNDEEYPFGILETTAEEQDYIAKERESRDRAAAILEEKFAERGLKFTARFEGNIPLVAYGRLDGLPFYFRYRGDCGQLRLGHPNPQENLNRYIHDLSSALALAERLKKANQSETDEPFFPRSVSIRRTDPDRLFPYFIKKYAIISDYLGAPYASYLDSDETIDLFTKLVENLEDADFELH